MIIFFVQIKDNWNIFQNLELSQGYIAMKTMTIRYDNFGNSPKIYPFIQIVAHNLSSFNC